MALRLDERPELYPVNIGGYTPRLSVFRPSRIQSIRRNVAETRLKEIGEQVPVRDYWPVEWPAETDTLAMLYRAVIWNPFDACPRLILADYLEENGCPDADALSRLRGYVGGTYPNLPEAAQYRPVNPGYVGRGPYLTDDVWSGPSGMFMQACRAGLFVRYPITTVILSDRWPHDLESGDYAWADGDGYRELLNDESIVESPQSVINYVTACFMPKEAIYPSETVFGVYTRSNEILCLSDLSRAAVDLGRYAAGLPAMEWPESGETWRKLLEHSWKRWQTFYGVDADDLEDANDVAFDINVRRKDCGPSGLAMFRRLIANGSV